MQRADTKGKGCFHNLQASSNLKLHRGSQTARGGEPPLEGKKKKETSIQHYYDLLPYTAQHNVSRHCGYLCSWTCVYMWRQLVFPCGILSMRYLFIFSTENTHTYTTHLCFYCIITHPLIPSRGLSSAGTQHTPSIIADIKITCQNTFILAPVQISCLQSAGLCLLLKLDNSLLLVIPECSGEGRALPDLTFF